MGFREQLGKDILIFDGGLGTLLQARGLKPGELPESWNLSHPDIVEEIHLAYLSAGCDIINSNTFGVNALKWDDPAPVVEAAMKLARSAVRKAGHGYVALDLGPTGKLLEPIGDLPFEKAYELYAQVIRAGEAQADLILIETMGDTREIKAAVLAAKENSALPIVVTMIFDSTGRLLTGADIASAVAMLEGLGVCALGFNCGLGPSQMRTLWPQLLEASRLPLVINPNAGLPEVVDGETVYRILPEDFAGEMEYFANNHAAVLGGCCGTTPEHIRALAGRMKGRAVIGRETKKRSVISSYTHAVVFADKPLIIGERINPTGKKLLKEALRTKDWDYILREGLAQQEAGVQILDVNVGLPEIDEPAMMCEVVQRLQAVTDLPLQIDTGDAKALEAALRVYNGKAMINSVNGKQSSMDSVFPLAKKYGGLVVALTLDESGIPETAAGRIAIAEKILRTAQSYGLDREDLVFDALTLTISTGADCAAVTLETLDYIRHVMGIHTVLGVSNVSFGLPNRELLNASFLSIAMERGLSAAIMNPKSALMMGAYLSWLALHGFDAQGLDYIEAAGRLARALPAPAASAAGRTMPGASPAAGKEGAGRTPATAARGAEKLADAGADVPGIAPAATGNDAAMAPLRAAIRKGLKSEAGLLAGELLQETEPLAIIDRAIVPALDEVGLLFEGKKLFLPQLLMSADAASAAFAAIRESLSLQGKNTEKGPKIVIATVEGDIHDIGKNIVKVLLENYGYDVIDLGKDVPPQAVIDAVKNSGARLVGLSALMTTTVPAMEKTIARLREEVPDCLVMVGGAVLTQRYADAIGADFYSKDAMESVRYADRVLKTVG